jgi:hypothetical protein
MLSRESIKSQPLLMNKKTNRNNIDFDVHFTLNLPQASRLLLMNKKQTNRINIDFGVHFSLNLPQASRLLGMTNFPHNTNLSSRPERTRISCYEALTNDRVCGFQ